MFLRVVMVIKTVAVKLVCSRFVRRNGKKNQREKRNICRLALFSNVIRNEMALLSFSSVTINPERNEELLTSQSNTKQCARVANATVKHSAHESET